MSLTGIIITVIAIIWFVVWYNRKITVKNRMQRISEEKHQAEKIMAEERNRLRTEERVSNFQKERSLRVEQEANAGKVREERDNREKELRQKIEDRKKHESEEAKRKVEDKK
jgi:uncharacterized protein YpmB